MHIFTIPSRKNGICNSPNRVNQLLSLFRVGNLNKLNWLRVGILHVKTLFWPYYTIYGHNKYMDTQYNRYGLLTYIYYTFLGNTALEKCPIIVIWSFFITFHCIFIWLSLLKIQIKCVSDTRHSLLISYIWYLIPSNHKYIVLSKMTLLKQDQCHLYCHFNIYHNTKVVF